MSGPTQALPVWLRALSRVCLCTYPRAFRREHSATYVEGVAHRWSRERANRGAVSAAWLTLRWLAMDTAVGAFAAHRHARAGRNPLAADAQRVRRLRRVVGGTLADMRAAVRLVVSRPAFALLVVLTLGFGIGASAALFGVLDRVVLRPLPYANGDRMAYITFLEPRRGWKFTPTGEALERWRAGARTLERIETYMPVSYVRTGAGPAALLAGTVVSPGLPEMLGIRAVIGRIPTAQDVQPGSTPAVVLSESWWRREFGGNAGAIGQTLILNDTVFEIAGVWPASARLEMRRAPELWRVLPQDPLDAGRESARVSLFGYVLALMRPGATAGDIESELAGLSANLENVSEGVSPAISTPASFLGATFVQGLWLVFAGGLVLVLVAIVNTANLLLGRTLSRSGELALRMAVGGSRASLIRLFLVESLLLTVSGVLVGGALAAAGSGALIALLPQRLTVLDGAVSGGPVFLYASVIAGVCAILCTVIPALWLGTRDLHALMTRRMAGRASAGSTRGQAVLVAIQAAFAMLLVTGGAMTARSFQRLLAVDPGLELNELLSFAVSLPDSRYADSVAARAFHEDLRDRVLALPGVRGVTTSGNPLLNFSLTSGLPFLVGETEPEPGATFTSSSGVHPGFFNVAGIAVVEGRDFLTVDGEREVIVNQAFARRYSTPVLGRLLSLGEGEPMRIVGIVEDVRSAGLTDAADRVQLYMRSPGFNSTYERYIVRTAGDPAAAMAAIRTTVSELDPVLPIREAITGPELLRRETARHRFVAMLLAVFAALGLLLAVAGVYGVVSLDVSRRSREVGIRIALGAGLRRVTGDVLRTGLRPVVFGVVLGGAASLAGARHIEDALYAVSASDPASLGIGCLVLLAAAALACSIPAGRASRVDPVRVLRAD